MEDIKRVQTEKEDIIDNKISEQWEIELFTSSPLFKKYWTDRLWALIASYENNKNVVPNDWEDIQSFWLRIALNNKVLSVLKQLRDKPFSDIKSLWLSIATRMRLNEK